MEKISIKKTLLMTIKTIGNFRTKEVKSKELTKKIADLEKKCIDARIRKC